MAPLMVGQLPRFPGEYVYTPNDFNRKDRRKIGYRGAREEGHVVAPGAVRYVRRHMDQAVLAAHATGQTTRRQRKARARVTRLVLRRG